ncbi:MAG: signal peptidase I [Christensenellales bacterium]|jgi:signal peptidase I
MKRKVNTMKKRVKKQHVQAPARSGVAPVIRNNREDSVFDWIKALVLAIAIAVSIRMFVLEFQKVDGPSMLPTLETGETIFINKLAYIINEPKRGEVIICHFPNSDDTYVKRIIGLPGETVEIKSGTVYIDGKADEDIFGNDKKVVDSPPIKVPDDCVFVMGDNRNYSLDSSSPQVGPIQLENVMGRVQAVVWPADKAKSVYDSGIFG